MYKFDRLLKRIKVAAGSALYLSDFGLDPKKVAEFVAEINKNPKITILCLSHNNLDDSTAEHLAKLEHVTSLDISYNDFTEKGISLIQGSLSQYQKAAHITLYSKYNDTRDRRRR